jgi:hypothetical protein
MRVVPEAKRFSGALLKVETVSGYPNIHQRFFVSEELWRLPAQS